MLIRKTLATGREMSAAFLLLAMTDCYAITDADQRAYCQAIQQNNVGACYAIQSPNLRTQCRAELSDDKSKCYAISNQAERVECQIRAQNGR